MAERDAATRVHDEASRPSAGMARDLSTLDQVDLTSRYGVLDTRRDES